MPRDPEAVLQVKQNAKKYQESAPKCCLSNFWTENSQAVTASGSGSTLHCYQAREVETSLPPKGGSNLTWQVSPPLH